MTETFEAISKDISGGLGSILGTRVYIAIYSENGEVFYQEQDLDQFQNFIRSFVLSNFSYLTVGDHSLPLSGHNIVFFKFDHAMLILYTKKGKLGQLLAFKSQMSRYFDRINTAIDAGGVAPTVEAAVPASTVAVEEEAIFVSADLVRDERENLIPVLQRKLTGKEKLEMRDASILRMVDGDRTLEQFYEKEGSNIIDEVIYTLFKDKWVEIRDHKPIQIKCPVCKEPHYEYVPLFCLRESPQGNVRKQISNASICPHTFLGYFDKKGKAKAQELKEKISDFEYKLDIFNMSIEKLIRFLGQDMFNNIFRSVFFRRKVVVIEDDSLRISKIIFDLLSRIFGNIHYNEHIVSMTRAEFTKEKKKYQNFLVVDASYNSIMNELYRGEDEALDFETKLFKEIIKEPDEQKQFLKTYDAFARIFVLTEKIIDEIKIYLIKQISEEDLIDRIKRNHDMDLELEDIPLIKKLSLIYYAFNINKIVIKTVKAKVSDWFDSI